jgi:hypothetical protein
MATRRVYDPGDFVNSDDLQQKLIAILGPE